MAVTARAASEITYELESLGWKAFQDLCATILSELLGQTFQVFRPARDGGRDGAFHGQWVPKKGEALEGPFTVQCKFTTQHDNLGLALLGDELTKARRLGSRGLANSYILMTNFAVTGVAEEAIRAAFLGLEGIKNFHLFGRDWVVHAIHESSRLRMLVPRVYGLGDLSQILDERARSQAAAILSFLGDNLSKFVLTEAYRRSARALIEHGFVLLLGEPAAGKSTIAASLALGALDSWSSSTFKIRSADEFAEHWNPDDPHQFFWVDDAFGVTQYQREAALRWNGVFPHMAAAVRHGARVVFTSRDYIYHAALHDIKVGAFPLIGQSYVVVNVQQLSLAEKQQMLYNHIRLGTQPQGFRTRIKPFLGEVASNPRFLPEIARRLGDPLFTRKLELVRAEISRFVEEPVQFLVDVVSSLDRESRAALALVFMRAGALESPIFLLPREEEALELLGVSLAQARDALANLKSSLVSLVHSDGRSMWVFKHPTIGDAYASIVAEDPELLDIYLSWTSPDRLIREVTCGDVRLEGAKVIVPDNRFERFLERLEEIEQDRVLLMFLATRCSRTFLALYARRHPDVEDSMVRPSSFLSASPEAHLLVRFSELGLLTEERRVQFVERCKTLLLETPDVDFLTSPKIRALFTKEELSDVRTTIQEDLLPGFSEIIEDWQSNCDSETDPEDELYPLSELLAALREEFKDQASVLSLIDGAEKELDDAIQGLLDERDPFEDDDEDYLGRAPRSTSSGDRSIFEDVDQ
jgi:hypothetical protein